MLEHALILFQAGALAHQTRRVPMPLNHSKPHQVILFIGARSSFYKPLNVNPAWILGMYDAAGSKMI